MEEPRRQMELERQERDASSERLIQPTWTTSDIPQPGIVLNNRYKLIERIGKGGMGVVFRAEHLELGFDVAIKFVRIDKANQGDAARRLRKEARVIASLRHESIAQVLDCQELHPGTPYLVLEYVPGLTIAQSLETDGPMEVRLAVELLLQASSALIEAHAAGVIHRDLKPQNLMIVRRENGEQRLKILDFGIARHEAPGDDSRETLATTDSFGGTPHYIAPEVARGEQTGDERADVYALGAVFFEMLTGEKVHRGESRNAVLYRVTTAEARSIKDVIPDTENEIAEIIRQALHSNPKERTPTMSVFREQLLKLTIGTVPLYEQPAPKRSRLQSMGILVACVTATTAASTIGYQLGFASADSSTIFVPTPPEVEASKSEQVGTPKPHPPSLAKATAQPLELKPRPATELTETSRPQARPASPMKTKKPAHADEGKRVGPVLHGFKTENPYQ